GAKVYVRDRWNGGTHDVHAPAQIGISLHDAKLLRSNGHAATLAHRRSKQHVRAFLTGRHVEPSMGMLFQDRWCKGAKALAKLDTEIHFRLHISSARIAKDASCPQRPRTEFHAILEPAHDLAFSE